MELKNNIYFLSLLVIILCLSIGIPQNLTQGHLYDDVEKLYNLFINNSKSSVNVKRIKRYIEGFLRRAFRLASTLVSTTYVQYTYLVLLNICYSCAAFVRLKSVLSSYFHGAKFKQILIG